MRSARQLLDALAGHGAKVVVAGDRIKLIKPTGEPLPAELISAARSQKDELRALVDRTARLAQPSGAVWDREDWQAFFDEAAGIARYDNGLSLIEAEACAFESCVSEWLNRNFVRSQPGRCVACGGRPDAHDPLLPYGTERFGHAWLHFRCWPNWHAARTAEAISALAAMGLQTPAHSPGKITE